MKLRSLLNAGFVLLLCAWLNPAIAQCTRSQSSCTKSTNAERTEQSDKQSKSECSSSYPSYYNQICGTISRRNSRNNLMVLGGATLDPTTERVALATGLEYGRRLTPQLGVGALVEMRNNDADQLNLRFGVPLNIRPLSRNLQISAGPMFATTRSMVEEVIGGTQEEPEFGQSNEWSNSWGARVSLSYFLNFGHLVLAPTAKVDYLNEQWQPTLGVNLGMGF